MTSDEARNDGASSENDAARTDDVEDDASRFGGARTTSTDKPRVGWSHDAEDEDALLSRSVTSDDEGETVPD